MFQVINYFWMIVETSLILLRILNPNILQQKWYLNSVAEPDKQIIVFVVVPSACLSH